MRNLIRSLAAAIALLTASQAVAQNFPLTMPANTVYGRLSIGPGPGSAIPFSAITGQLFSAGQNTAFMGPSSGGTGNAIFRAIVGSDLPAINLAASGAGGVTGQLPIANNCPGATGASSSTFLRGDCTWGTPNSTILSSPNTFTGTFNIFNGPVRFGSVPWVDVKSGANGCAVAVGNGTADDTSAIQCQITFMGSAGGGIVFISPGTYLVSGSGLIVPAGVWLEGVSVTSSIIVVNTNIPVISFAITGASGTCPSGNHNGGMERIFAQGYSGATPSNYTVYVGAGCNVTIRDARILLGAYGLWNDGVDTLVENSFIWGFTNALISHGANWYIRVKFDQPSTTAAVSAYVQGAPAAPTTTAENHFIHCDFSGSYSSSSVTINDTVSTSAVTTFEGSVFSSPIIITNSKVVMFSANEFGSTSISIASGLMSIAGSYAFSATTVTGAGSRSCGANINITC